MPDLAVQPRTWQSEDTQLPISLFQQPNKNDGYEIHVVFMPENKICSLLGNAGQENYKTTRRWIGKSQDDINSTVFIRSAITADHTSAVHPAKQKKNQTKQRAQATKSTRHGAWWKKKGLFLHLNLSSEFIISSQACVALKSPKS